MSSAHFKFEHFAIVVFQDGALCVRCLLRGLVIAIRFNTTVDHLSGRFALIGETVQSAVRVNGNWMFVLVQAPARKVKLVRTCVSNIAVTGVPIPVEIVMTAFLIVGSIGGRAQPTVVMKGGRRGAVFRDAIGVASFVAYATGHVHFPYATVVEELDGFYDAGHGTVIQPY